jgi:FSR family fosmidomycin resistance protein-like MFS transporter
MPAEAAPETAVAAPFQTDQVAVISAAHFTHDTYTAFLAPLLVPIQAALGLSYSAVGTLAIITQIPSLLNPFIGYLADRVSVRWFVILAPAVTATLYSSLGLVSTYLGLAIMLFAAGISIAAFHAPAPAMIAKVAGAQVGKGMSFFMGAGELARAVGPLVAAGGLAWLGLDGMWRLAGFGWLVSLILYFRLRHVAATPRRPGEATLAAFWPQARRFFPLLAWLSFGSVFMLAALTTFLPIYMGDERGATLWVGAAALTALQAAGFAGALTMGTTSDRLGRKKVLLILVGAAPLLFLAFIFAPAALALPLLLLLGFAALAPQPVVMALVQDQFSENRALANGTYLAISFLLRSLSIWAVGLAADSYGMNWAFVLAAIMGLLSIPAVRYLPD